MAKNNEVAVVETKSNELAIAGVDMSELFSGVTGFEGADAAAYSIPFIYVLQKMSPACDEDSDAYVEGAKAGNLINTVTGEIYDAREAGARIIPCYFKRSFIEWGPRGTDDAGFKGEHAPEAVDKMIAAGEVVEYEGKLLRPMGDGKLDVKKCVQLVDTRAHYVLVQGADGNWSQALLPCSSTQIKASKNMMMMLQQKKVDTPQGKRTPPMYANIVKLTTFGRSNESGSWSALKVELDGMVTERDLFMEAMAFAGAVAGGEVAVDYNKAGEAANGSEDKPADSF